jgi:hypothetical protein
LVVLEIETPVMATPQIWSERRSPSPLGVIVYVVVTEVAGVVPAGWLGVSGGSGWGRRRMGGRGRWGRALMALIFSSVLVCR